MFLSIKARQVAGVTSLVGFVVVVLSGLHLLSLVRTGLEESRSRGEMLAHVVFQRAREVVSTGADPYDSLRHDAGIRAILESSIAYSRHVTYAAVADADGVAVAHSFRDLEGAGIPSHEDLATLLRQGGLAQLRAVYTDRTLEVRQPLLMGDREFGSIRIGVSTMLMRSELQEALRSAALVALVSLLIATIGAMFLARWILRPIYVIGSGLTRLGRGELDVTLDLPSGGEFRDLGSSFHAISERLAARGPLVPEPGPAPPGPSRAFVTLGRLFGGLAHEVRNPLNGMTIHLELLKQKLQGAGAEAGPAPLARPGSEVLAAGSILGVGRLTAHGGAATAEDGEPPPPLAASDVAGATRHVGVIDAEIKRLDQVLQDFLKFVRVEEVARRPVAVSLLVEEVCRIIEPDAQRDGVTLRAECGSDLPPVHGDPGLLRQALLNLALNACQAMADGGTLRFGCRAVGGRVEITVDDTGAGIPPEELGRIFDLFYTTRKKGSGIGLPMVYRTVQLHDGEIEVESTPGSGTTFRLLLPQA